MLALFIDVLSGCRGYKFMGLKLSRVMGMGISKLLMTGYWGCTQITGVILMKE